MLETKGPSETELEGCRDMTGAADLARETERDSPPTLEAGDSGREA